MTPINPIIADLLNRLATQLQAELRQRIEQLEFQADYPYRLQQCIDLVETLRHKLSSQQHMTCLRIELDGSTEFVVTTNLEWAHQYVANVRAEVIAEESIDEIIKQQFGGIAALTFLG